MTKRWIALSLSVLFLALPVVAGCGGDEDELYQAAPKDSGKKAGKQQPADGNGNGGAATPGGGVEQPAAGGTSSGGSTGKLPENLPPYEDLEVVKQVKADTPEDGWGHLVGRFVFDGSPPVAEKLSVTKDQQYCTKHHPVDESLVVSDKHELANAVVFLRVKDPVDVHASYEETASGEVSLDNKFCRFDPHVAVLRTTQTLLLKNTDTIAHNVKADLFVNASFNILIPPGNTVPKSFGSEERLPAPVGCNIHPWMQGYVLVREDPYMAVSAKDGTFVIKNIPAGEHEFQLWQEISGYLDGAKVQGKTVKKGRFDVTIKSGEVTDLQNIIVPSRVLN